MTFPLLDTATATNLASFVEPSIASNVAPGPPGMPRIVLAAELYFWSAEWQSQEREFEAARERGELIEASSMDEVIRDLMRVDD